MCHDEGRLYLRKMVMQLEAFAPDEIIAVARSGFSYAMWAAQQLNLPLGAYWPERELLVCSPLSQRVVFVDDNTVDGETYLATKHVMARDYPAIEWKWAVLFSDWNTPESVRNEIIQGVRLPYFAEEPMWGSMKISQAPGVRYRDE